MKKENPYSKQIEELLAFEESDSSDSDGPPQPGDCFRIALPIAALIATMLAFIAGWYASVWVHPPMLPPSVRPDIVVIPTPAAITKHPEGPIKPDPGAIGWQPKDGTSVGGKHWCRVGVPVEGWGLRQCAQPNPATPPTRLKVLTYNVYWWNLFLKRGGNGKSAGKLIADASQQEAFDVMGFQECNDIVRVLRDAQESGLKGRWRSVGPANPVAGAVAVAWRDDAWRTLNFGMVDIAEDAPEEWWGIRYAAFVRLQHLQSGKKAFFINHHGPLPVKSPGGLCGADATAYNLLKIIGYHAMPGDNIVLLGDFNAEKSSATANRLSQYMDHVYSGSVYGGVDNVFSACAQAVEKMNLGSGGSDHDALSVVFNLQ